MGQKYTFPFLLAGLLCWLSSTTTLQAQILDPSFQPTALKTPLGLALQSGVNTMAVQPDGKILVAGGFDFVNGSLTGKIQRFDAAGVPDATFNVGGTGANAFISAIVLQPDGKILVGGGFTTFNGLALPMVVRLNANGSLDTGFTFGTASTFRQISSLALQPDGKILVGSGAPLPLTATANPAGVLVRLMPNGAVDPSFNAGPANASGGIVSAILVQTDGSIVIGGSFSGFNGQQLGSLLRFTSNGALDPTFAYNAPVTNATVRGSVTAIVQQPDGRLVVAGNFQPSSGATFERLVRLMPDGSMDGTFQPGAGPNNLVRSIALEPNGNLLIGGGFTQVDGTSRNRLARLTPTGALDASYGDPAGANAPVNTVALLPNGQAVIGGVFTQYSAANFAGLVRLTAGTGILDNTFAPVIEARGTITKAVPLPNGQTLVSGNFAQFNGAAAPGALNSVRRINANGTLDANFASVATGSLQAVEPNGNFYVMGPQTVSRVLASGAVDNNFTSQTFGAPGTAGPLNLTGVVSLPTGQVLVFGRFSTYGALTGLNGLLRINANGSADNTFVPPALPGNSRVSQVLVQPSGKLVVEVQDIFSFATSLVRLNPNGTTDNTFSVGTAAGGGFSTGVLMQPDGRLLVSGSFTSFNGQPAPFGLIRLTADGANDPTYSGVADFYSPRVVQADGRLLASTGNSVATGATRTLVRLNSNGSLDTGFSPVATPQSIFTGDDIVTGVALQPADGKILLFGSFRYVAGQVRIGLARLSNVGLATRTAAATLPLHVYPNPARAAVTVALPAATQSRPATLLDLQGRVVRRWEVPAQQAETRLNLEAIAPGVYLLQVHSATALYQRKVVVKP